MKYGLNMLVANYAVHNNKIDATDRVNIHLIIYTATPVYEIVLPVLFKEPCYKIEEIPKP